MSTANASADEQGIDTPKFTRPPLDRLFMSCVLGASLVYVAFLVVMALLPAEPEDSERQGYLGVVSGDSQPSGFGGGEEDPATGTAEPGGTRSAYYIGSGAPPRPVTLSETEQGQGEPSEQRAGAPMMVPAARFERGVGWGGSRLSKLAVDKLVLGGVEQLVERVRPLVEDASEHGGSALPDR